MSSEPNASRACAHRAFDLTLVRHVGDAADRAIAELAGGGVECLRIQIAEQHARASFDERRRDRFADAGCGAGHDRAFVSSRISCSTPSKMPAAAGRFDCSARARMETTRLAGLVGASTPSPNRSPRAPFTRSVSSSSRMSSSSQRPPAALVRPVVEQRAFDLEKVSGRECVREVEDQEIVDEQIA